MRNEPVTVRSLVPAGVSPRLVDAALAQLRERGFPPDVRRLVFLPDGRIELDLTPPARVPNPWTR